MVVTVALESAPSTHTGPVLLSSMHLLLCGSSGAVLPDLRIFQDPETQACSEESQFLDTVQTKQKHSYSADLAQGLRVSAPYYLDLPQELDSCPTWQLILSAQNKTKPNLFFLE